MGSKRTYFWVYGVSDQGKRALIGPYTNEVLANEACDSLQDAEVIQLPTKSQQSATRMLRAKLLAEGKTVDSAMERQLHNKALRRTGVKIPITGSIMVADSEDIFGGDPFE